MVRSIKKQSIKAWYSKAQFKALGFGGRPGFKAPGLKALEALGAGVEESAFGVGVYSRGLGFRVLVLK